MLYRGIHYQKNLNLLDKDAKTEDKKDDKHIHLEKQNENKLSTNNINEPFNNQTSWKSYNIADKR